MKEKHNRPLTPESTVEPITTIDTDSMGADDVTAKKMEPGDA